MNRTRIKRSSAVWTAPGLLVRCPGEVWSASGHQAPIGDGSIRPAKELTLREVPQ
jgi:hypothetical protein